MMAVDPAWIALIGTLAGGIGLKVAEHWLGRSQVKVDEASKIRNELRLEIVAQREEIRLLEGEVSKWRENYYNLRDEMIKLQTELTVLKERLNKNLGTPPV